MPSFPAIKSSRNIRSTSTPGSSISQPVRSIPSCQSARGCVGWAATSIRRSSTVWWAKPSSTWPERTSAARCKSRPWLTLSVCLPAGGVFLCRAARRVGTHRSLSGGRLGGRAFGVRPVGHCTRARAFSLRHRHRDRMAAALTPPVIAARWPVIAAGSFPLRLRDGKDSQNAPTAAWINESRSRLGTAQHRSEDRPDTRCLPRRRH